MVVVVTRMAKCDNCGYEWDYSGELEYATCPSCRKKTEVSADD